MAALVPGVENADLCFRMSFLWPLVERGYSRAGGVEQLIPPFRRSGWL